MLFGVSPVREIGLKQVFNVSGPESSAFGIALGYCWKMRGHGRLRKKEDDHNELDTL
jgi:hypothetical protein